MVYYHILISKNTSNLCTIIIPQEIYCYKRLAMGSANSTDIFQHKMNDLFHGFEFICVYIDEILIWTKGYWTDHVHNLNWLLINWREKDLNLILKSHSSDKYKLEYLCFWVTRDGVKPINRNIEAITNMNPTTTWK